MKTKHYLLSYKWQTAGWILLAVALMLTCLIVGVGLYMTMSEAVTKLFVAAVYVVTALSLLLMAVTKLFVAAVYVVTAVSLLLIAFSEERQEDEFIKSLRGRSLAAAACVAFVLSIIWFCVSNVGQMGKVAGCCGLRGICAVHNLVLREQCRPDVSPFAEG